MDDDNFWRLSFMEKVEEKEIFWRAGRRRRLGWEKEIITMNQIIVILSLLAG